MKSIAVINLKGGVGKTHASWLIAGACQDLRRRLLLIDLDTQSNLSNSFVETGNERPCVERLFDPAAEAAIADLIQPTVYGHIDIMPAGPELARFDFTDRREWEKSDSHLTLIEPLATIHDEYDYIVFDCPPRLSVVSYAALCAADYVVIPLEAADWGAQGIMQVTAAINEVQRLYNPRLKLLGYLVSRFKRASIPTKLPATAAFRQVGL